MKIYLRFAYNLMKFRVSLRGLVGKILTIRQQHIEDLKSSYTKNKEDNSLASVDIEVNASLTATIFTEILFFPMETIIHRLYLQVIFSYFNMFNQSF